MSEVINKSPEKMSVIDRQNLEQQIKETEEVLNNADGLKVNESLQSRSEMRSQLEKKKTALARDEELEARGDSDKNRIYARIREIESLVKQHMPTKREMWAKMGSDDSESAVQKNLWFHKKFQPLLLELQNLKKRLDPKDPMAGDLERIRPA